MKLLRRGNSGDSVLQLQKQLQILGLYSGKTDGLFGRMTERAVKAFQIQNALLADGIAGPQTRSAIDRSVVANNAESTKNPQKINDTWERFQEFIRVMKTPVRYGPGRGMFHENQWVVTWGAIALGKKDWPVLPGKTRGPSLHCSSLTNFLLGYLLNYNDNWTHSGNRPLLEELCVCDSKLHEQPRGGGARWRGYGECMMRLASDGDTQERIKHRLAKPGKYLDAHEIWDRQEELETFNFFSQSSKKNGRWNLDHHTGAIIVDKESKQLFRLAADGYRTKNSPRSYSATSVSYKSLKHDWPQNDVEKIYQIFKLCPQNAPAFAAQASPATISVEP